MEFVETCCSEAAIMCVLASLVGVFFVRQAHASAAADGDPPVPVFVYVVMIVSFSFGGWLLWRAALMS